MFYNLFNKLWSIFQHRQTHTLTLSISLSLFLCVCLLLSPSCFDFAVDGIPNSPQSLCFCCCLRFSCKNIFITNKIQYYYYYCLFPDICTIYICICLYVCISYAKGNRNIRKPPEKRGPFTRKETKQKKQNKRILR